MELCLLHYRLTYLVAAFQIHGAGRLFRSATRPASPLLFVTVPRTPLAALVIGARGSRRHRHSGARILLLLYGRHHLPGLRRGRGLVLDNDSALRATRRLHSDRGWHSIGHLTLRHVAPNIPRVIVLGVQLGHLLLRPHHVHLRVRARLVLKLGRDRRRAVQRRGRALIGMEAGLHESDRLQLWESDDGRALRLKVLHYAARARRADREALRLEWSSLDDRQLDAVHRLDVRICTDELLRLTRRVGGSWRVVALVLSSHRDVSGHGSVESCGY